MNFPFSIEPMGVGAIIDRSFKTYRNAFLPILVISALIGGAGTIVSLVITTAMSSAGGLNYMDYVDMFTQMFQSGTFDFDQYLYILQSLTGLGGAASTATSIISFFLSPIAGAGLAAVVAGYYFGEKRSVGEWLGFVMKRYGTFLVIEIASGVMMVLVALLFVVVFMLLVFLSALIGEAMAWLGVLLMVAALIVMLFVLAALGVAVSMIYVVAIMENLTGFKPIRRAFKLVFSKFGRSFGTIFLVTLIVGIVEGVVGGLLGLVAGALSSGAIVSAVTWLSTAVSLLLAPISGIAVVFLYFSIRIEKEGYDLELRAMESGEPVGYNPFAAGFSPAGSDPGTL